MGNSSKHSILHQDHTVHAIQQRIGQQAGRGYLSDAVLGAIDGAVTTFAVAAAAVGGGLSGTVVIVMGFANLLADGFSMAASNYLAAKSEIEGVERARREEEDHIHHVPWGEREEVRQIFQGKGFSGDLLEQIVSVITASKDLWVDTMLTEEHGLSLATPNPLRAGLATFAAFILVGLLPLLPFLAAAEATTRTFGISLVVTAAAFGGVGLLKGRILQRSMIRSGLETLVVGCIAAALAYGAGYVLRQMYDSGSAQLMGWLAAP
ncbi:MAG TPA: VIT1/CCC1 transporter family protein [Steroidobacter sp.]|uniref:VIT1/CCC1 transporter family protein n=1 Tax=Steroidobacter sp. TaxID=1978227 RepID=UPI002ED9E043